MIPLEVYLDGEDCWPDLLDKPLESTLEISIAVLKDGTSGGKPSVTIRFDLSDGRVVVGQTSARLFCTAAKMIMAKYPDLFHGT